MQRKRGEAFMRLHILSDLHLEFEPFTEGDFVLARAELIRRDHALQHVHGHFHQETVGISQAVKMLEEIAGFVV